MPQRPPAESVGMGRLSGRELAATVILCLLAAIALMLLSGCATTQGPSPDVGVALPPLPSSLSAACARPVRLPTAGLNAQDTERYWATDRTNLAKCGDRHSAVVQHYEILAGNFAGAAK